MSGDTQSKILTLVLNLILKELKKTEFQTEVLRPILKSAIWYLAPYLLIFFSINLFFMMIGFSLVLHFKKK